MISIIVAMDKNKGIGKNNGLPWYLPSDLMYFKRVTMEHTIVMGRKTFDAIGKTLPRRKNVILTRDLNFTADGCDVIHEVEEIALYTGEVFVIGGADIIRQCMGMVNRIYLTYIDEVFDCDTFLDAFQEADWVLASEERGVKDEKNPYDYYFRVYDSN
jgi:dihydrofolate reductase